MITHASFVNNFEKVIEIYICSYEKICKIHADAFVRLTIDVRALKSFHKIMNLIPLRISTLKIR